MKKLLWLILAISILAYASGLSSLARTRMLPRYGLRVSSFTFDTKSWLHSNHVYATGTLNVSDSNHNSLESRECAIRIDLESDPNTSKPVLIDRTIPESAIALNNLSVTYGADARATAKEHAGEIYSVSASISGTHFIVDARADHELRVFPISLAEGYKRTQEAKDRMWIMTPLAHLIDFITAPLQLIYVLLVFLIFPSWN